MSNEQDPRKGWTAELVREHLQNAVYLELWTIPLYLAAAYSIQAPIDPATGRPEIVNIEDLPRKPDGSLDFAAFTGTQATQYAFDSILSVAIQEMLHLELASNILNAVRSEDPSATDPWVRFTGQEAPSYESAPSCLDAPLPEGVKLTIGPFRGDGSGGVQPDNQLRLFQWIESEREAQGDPQAYRPQYDSIGNFYTALSFGLAACWSELYPAAGRNPDPLQKDDWGEATVKAAAANRPAALPAVLRRNVLRNLARLGQANAGGSAAALAVANAAVDAGDYPFSIKIQGTPTDALAAAQAAILAIQAQGEGAGGGQEVPPQYIPTTGEAIEIFLDSQSHYERFTQLLQLLDSVAVIEVRPPEQDHTLFEEALNFSYSAFLQSLDVAFASADKDVSLGAMKGLGNRVLEVWQRGGSPQFTWEDPSSYVDPQQTKHYHACQGLGPTGTNDCATAYFHACSTTNMCAGQGGCGLKGGDPDGDWRPGKNSGQGNGGCGVPIPATQVFNANPDPNMGGLAPQELQNQNVWEYARKLMGFTDALEPNALRASLTPTSPVYPPPPKDDA